MPPVMTAKEFTKRDYQSYPLRYTYRKDSAQGENRVEVASKGMIQRNGAFDATIIGGKEKSLKKGRSKEVRWHQELFYSPATLIGEAIA